MKRWAGDDHSARGRTAEPARSWAQQTWEQWLTSQLDPSWRTGEWEPRRRVFTGDVGNPMTAVYSCRVERCDTQVENFNRRCSRCRRHYDRSQQPAGFDHVFDPDAYPRPGKRGAAVGNFDLSGVDPVAAAELMCGLEQRDRDGIILVPGRIRRIAIELPPDCGSLLSLAGDAQFENALPRAALGVFRSIATHLGRAHTVFTGVDPTLGDVWKPAVVGCRRRRIATTAQSVVWWISVASASSGCGSSPNASRERSGRR